MGRAGGVVGRVRRVAFVAALAGAFVGLTAAPAAAAETPPGWQPGHGWVYFELDHSQLAAGDAVTLIRTYGGSDLLGAFSNWGPENAPGGPPTWPTSWSAGGVGLQRTGDCEYTSGSCSYQVVSANPGPFQVAASDDDPATGQPLNDPNNAPHATITNPPPPPPPPADPIFVGNVSYTGGSGGAPGSAVFNASGSVGRGGVAPSFFVWTLTEGASVQTFECTTAQCPAPSSVQLLEGHTYSVKLEMLDGARGSLGGSDLAPFAVPVSAPAPSPTPAPAPAPSSGGGAPAGGGGIPGVFARPVSRAPEALTGGTGAAFPTVVWLWRPDWFKIGTDNALPRTDGQPEVKGKTAVVVSTDNLKDDTNAGPWLAGLGAFGLIAGGFLFNRWRRVYRPSS